MKHLTVPVALLFSLVAPLSTQAQTRWVSGYGIMLCPTPKIDFDKCTRPKSGTALTPLGMVQDDITRKFYKVELSTGEIRFVYEYDFKNYTQAEDPKIIAERDRQAAAKAAAERKKNASIAEAKRLKQAEEDEAEMAKMPPTALSTPCILAAAEKLPRIPGIVIEASRALPIPPELKKEPGLYHTIIEIDAKAAGVAATYRFVCAKGLRTPPIVVGIRN